MSHRPSLSILVVLVLAPVLAAQPGSPLVYEGKEGPGKGKHIVLIAGDEEYRSEEALPMLGKILAVRHGFTCTVLFSLDPETGVIDPGNQTNIPGTELLRDADVMVLFLRFRELPDVQMKPIVAFVESGKPILGIRTATHSFQYKRNKKSPYAHYTSFNKKWRNGFGKQILGETWVSHHGHHGRESTRGIVADDMKGHPIVRGVSDIWGPTDVYGVRKLPEDAKVLVKGQVLAGMKPGDPPLAGRKNDPMMPLIWIREMKMDDGGTRRVICSTIGASQDFESAGLRRCVVNACYWGMGLEAKIPARSDVNYVGKYAPTRFGFKKYTPGIKPSDHALRSAEK